jgi:DNA polymerase III delta prime subunit
MPALFGAAKEACKALLCPTGGCGSCLVCRKIDAEQHPDILFLRSQDKDIPVADVRALRAEMWVVPNEGARKIAVIGDAARLNLHGQNALLTLLEEPPSYGAVFLLLDSAAKLLPTVRSRCVTQTVSGENAPPEPGETAKNLLSALKARDELGALKAALGWEKTPRQELQAELDGLISLLRAQIFEDKGLTRAELLRMIDVAVRYRSSLDRNAGSGHVCAALAADLTGGGFPA